MSDEEAPQTAALWYWRYHSIEVELYDDEAEAAAMAYWMAADGQGSPSGVQLRDGTLHPADDWPALKSYEEERDRIDAERWERQKNTPPPATRTIRSPFDPGRTTTVLESEEVPEWVGKQDGNQ